MVKTCQRFLPGEVSSVNLTLYAFDFQHNVFLKINLANYDLHIKLGNLSLTTKIILNVFGCCIEKS